MQQTDKRNLTPERRSEIARRGGHARWKTQMPAPAIEPFVSQDPGYESKRRYKAKKRAERQVERIEAGVPGSAVDLYRAEKERSIARHASKMADAKAAFQQMLDDAAAARKGGRPPKIKCGKAQLTRDPLNALIEALESSALRPETRKG